MWSHILMILNFWPDAFLAFFWKIPGCLSPHTGRKAKECLSEPGTVELWRRRRTIYVTGHLGFMETNDEWKSEITEINHLKKWCSWSRPQTNWEPIWLTHGKLSPFFFVASAIYTVDFLRSQARAPGPPSKFMAPGGRGVPAWTTWPTGTSLQEKEAFCGLVWKYAKNENPQISWTFIIFGLTMATCCWVIFG